jgi:serine protease Do
MKKLILIMIIALWANTLTFCKSESDSRGSVAGDKIYVDSKGSSSANNDSIDKSRLNAITKVVQAASPAIVGINVTEVVNVKYRDPYMDDPFFSQFFGRQTPRYRSYEVQSVGSGFIISPDGYILTNHHVAGNAAKILITTTDGKTHDAEIIGADLTTDVALLKIKGEDFPFLQLANSDDVVIGEWAIAFGNPFGLFTINAKPTVTVGVVSNKGVSFTQEDRVYKDMIQTDAAISSGNSGGPLLNANGEVIGINTVIFSTSQSNQGAGSIGIGFSIPINRIKGVVDVLASEKKINRDYNIGFEVRKNDEKVANYFGLKSTEGVVIVNMYRNSPALKAGMEPGDIILGINGASIEREDDYLIAILDAKVGDEMSFEILRGDEKMTKSFKLTQNRR